MDKLGTQSSRVRKWAVRARPLLFLLVGLLAGYGLWGRGPADVSKSAKETSHAGRGKAPASNVKFWTCSMHPQIRRDGPGLCPICAMELVPVTGAEGAGLSSLRGFRPSPAALELMNIETAEVRRQFVTKDVRMVGKVDYDETRLGYITAWVSGRIDRMYVDYTGVQVNKGDHMVYLYSPDLLVAQDELRRAARAIGELRPGAPDVLKTTAEAALQAAREKLRRWGLTEQQIASAEKQGVTSDHITIYAPMSGTVIERSGRDGMYVEEGTRIYTIADLSVVWVRLDAYESDLAWLHYGQKVVFTTEAYPGEQFEGRISFIDPVLDKMTRTVKVRVVAPNPDGRLKPEMFVRSVVHAQVATGGRVMDPELAGKWISPMHPEIIKDKPGVCDICGMPLVRAEELGYAPADAAAADKPLVVPASAVLTTGTRAIVYVQLPDEETPTFEGREIVLGPRAGDFYLVRAGLLEGERVVTRGAFKIDSALQIQAKPSMMTPGGGGGGGEHDHGGAAAGATAAAAADMDTGGLPFASREQIQALLTAYAALDESRESTTPADFEKRLGAFETALDAVNSGLMTGHTLMLWNEYAMRLRNGAVELHDARDARAKDAAWARLAADVGEMRERLRLEAEGAGEHMPRHETPAEFQAQLTKVFDAYLKITAALARDSLADAQAAAGEAQQALGAVEMRLLDGEAHTAWMKSAEELGSALGAMKNADSIGRIREALPALTASISGAIGAFGLAPDRSAYTAFCPMAFDTKGAEWLQADTAIRNPYFGAMMLECGVIRGKLSAPPAETGHEGHAHE